MDVPIDVPAKLQLEADALIKKDDVRTSLISFFDFHLQIHKSLKLMRERVSFQTT